MNAITVKLPDRLRERVGQESRQRGISRSQFVRLALERFLAEESGGGSVTCYEIMKDGVGMVKDAPSDLSYSRRHMKGFGR